MITLNGTFNTRTFEMGAVPTERVSAEDSRIRFGAIRETASSIIEAPRNPDQSALIAMLNGEPEFWMNGEGDPILVGSRTTFARTLLIMEIALQLGCRVRLVNSMLSKAPGDAPILPVVRRAMGSVIVRCSSVTYRDPESLELHKELYPKVNADWTPDALFTWAGRSLEPGESPGQKGPATEGLSMPTVSLLTSGEPYVAISGSSVQAADNVQRFEAVRSLIDKLRREGLQSLLVATDRADRWLIDVAKEIDSPSVDCDVPLVAARSVLAGARAYVSGRYHPSIIAYGAGVPCVLMESNSHKTRSVQGVLGLKVKEHAGFGASDVNALAEDTIAAAATSQGERLALWRAAVDCGRVVSEHFAELGVSVRGA